MLSLPLPYYDFHTYWFAGSLFLSGGHPYSSDAMLAMERLHDQAITSPQVMVCPPWILPFLAVIATPSFRVAQIGWFIASLILNCGSSLGLWIYFGGAKRQAWIALFVAFAFIPMGGAEFMGQITPAILACITAFLLLNKAKWHFAAGVSMLGFGLKPHLLYLVLLGILLWALQRRVWSLLLGAICSYVSAALFAVIYNPFSLEYLHHSVGKALTVPCGLGWVLRSFFGLQHTWIPFLPSFFGLLWFVFYWARHRSTWDWPTHLPLLLIVSIASAPYYWYHDFILILPALIALAVAGAYRFTWVSAAFLGVQAVIVSADMLSPAWMGVASLLWIPFYLTVRTAAAGVPSGKSLTTRHATSQALTAR
jgi:hypothetical protein